MKLANDPGSLQLLLAGDVMLARAVSQVVREHGPDYPLGALEPLTRNADLVLANLECVLTARTETFAGAPKAFYFLADPAAGKVLASAGVDFVSLANNHTLDAGPEGLADTLAELDRLGIASAGAGVDLDAASAVRALDANGMKVGVLSVCDHQEDFAATDRRPGIHYLDLRDSGARRHLIDRVRSEAARFDHLIVSLHWLPNWVSSVPVANRALADELVGAGARVLWGHSPHHVLGTEWWPTGVTLYSTGDLLDDYAVDPVHRNDCQFVYVLDLVPGAVKRVRAFPILLGVGRVLRADEQARLWLEARLRAACQPLGSVVAAGANSEFEIRAGAVGSVHGPGNIL